MGESVVRAAPARHQARWEHEPRSPPAHRMCPSSICPPAGWRQPAQRPVGRLNAWLRGRQSANGSGGRAQAVLLMDLGTMGSALFARACSGQTRPRPSSPLLLPHRKPSGCNRHPHPKRNQSHPIPEATVQRLAGPAPLTAPLHPSSLRGNTVLAPRKQEATDTRAPYTTSLCRVRVLLPCAACNHPAPR